MKGSVIANSTIATDELTVRFVQAMTGKDPAAVRGMLGDGFTFTTPEGASGDAAAFEVFLGRWGTGVPDFVQTPDHVVGDADSSACSFVFTGTNSGPLQTVDGTEIPATGKALTVHAAIFCRWKDGALTRLTFFWDQMSVLTQLGLA